MSPEQLAELLCSGDEVKQEHALRELVEVSGNGAFIYWFHTENFN